MKFFKKIVIIILSFFIIYNTWTCINFKTFFTKIINNYDYHIPSSYKYIKLEYKNINKNDDIYKILQKMVYLNIYPNSNITIPINKEINNKFIKFRLKKYFDIDNIKDYSINNIIYLINNNKKNNLMNNFELTIQEKIMQDVYKKIKTNHIYWKNIEDKDLEYWAIKWMVDSIWDKYSIFMKPKNSSLFKDTLNWEYEWIWAQIKLINNNFIIYSVFKQSPAEIWWLKKWDIIKSINWKNITWKDKIENIISYIKWPKWTKVEMKIIRWTKIKTLIIVRNKISLNWLKINQNILNKSFCYMKIDIFNNKIYDNFFNTINSFQHNNCKKYVFDLRDNPWWNLNEVSKILNFFVPLWKEILEIKKVNWIKKYYSDKKNIKRIYWKKIFILINSWSASASEIFTLVIKEYNKDNTKILWTTSYWKWTVQNIVDYIDWSIFKYTIAKRYTWKLKKNINKIWITPDIKIVDNLNTEIDEIIDYLNKHF